MSDNYTRGFAHFRAQFSAAISGLCTPFPSGSLAATRTTLQQIRYALTLSDHAARGMLERRKLVRNHASCFQPKANHWLFNASSSQYKTLRVFETLRVWCCSSKLYVEFPDKNF
jgi:hypothetical protein